jgi:hypothetical protein
MRHLMKMLAPALLILSLAACGAPAAATGPPTDTPAAPKRTFEFKFDNVQKDLEADPPVKGTAWVTITKHDPVAGEVKINYIHTEGDRIGWKLNEKGEWTSKHKVTSARTRRTVEVDFNNGAVIKEIMTDVAVRYQYNRCKIVFAPPSVNPCEGIEVRTDAYRAIVVTYLDQEGILQVVQKPFGRGPEEDQLCTLHGGKIPPNVPKTEKERKDRNASLAANLLWEADEGWKSKNPKVRTKAQEAYLKLLKDYPSEAVVEKNRERIKARSQAQIED